MATSNAQLEELLECPVCYQRLKPPVETCENGHGICGSCRKLVEYCGICRSKFTHARNTLLNQVIEAVEEENARKSGWWYTLIKILYNFLAPSNRLVKCKYRHVGCAKTLPFRRINDHEKICRYKQEKCFVCHQEMNMTEMNDHLKICKDLKAKMNVSFSNSLAITCQIPQVDQARYFVLRLTDINTFFIMRTIHAAEKMFFGVQYAGQDQENARNYKYDIKIDQGMPPPNQSYFSMSGLCVPYIFSKEETKKQKGVIELDMKSMFLSDDELPSRKYELNLTIYELLPWGSSSL